VNGERAAQIFAEIEQVSAADRPSIKADISSYPDLLI
jgi:hypothetical protein